MLKPELPPEDQPPEMIGSDLRVSAPSRLEQAWDMWGVPSLAIGSCLLALTYGTDMPHHVTEIVRAAVWYAQTPSPPQPDHLHPM